MPDSVNLDDRMKDALLALLESIEKEDEYLRLQQMRHFKKMNLFWHGFQYLYWSDMDQDWRVPTHEQIAEISSTEQTRYIFDRVDNHFKAHGESIIAALSSDIPTVRFAPGNAEDPNDHRAVQAADNCVEIIEKWNRAKLLVITALFHLCTEGFVASYTYNHKDPTYGTSLVPQYGTQTVTMPDELVCPNCGYSTPAPPEESSPEDNIQNPSSVEGQNFQSDSVNNDIAQSADNSQPCPQCGSAMQLSQGAQEEVPFLSGEKPVPKGREIIEIYGPLNVRVPQYVLKQADAGYLILYVDADPAVFKDAFPDVADEISVDGNSDYERQMRQSSLNIGGYELTVKLATQKRVWLRPWMLNRLGDAYQDVIADMRKVFPEGIYFSAIGRTICEVRNESMDPHWTITKTGPSKGLQADPILQSHLPLQEIRNDLLNLFLMQVEYSVPATYADTQVYDFQGMSKQEVAPGYIYPVSPRPGQSIADGFYSDKVTTLSKESTQLLDVIANDEQFVTGDYPSIYGGPSVSGSKTLGEYDKSRAFALQRLSLVWYFLDVWYGETLHKAVLSFLKHQVEDVSYTVQDNNKWQTKWIKQADLAGTFDRMEPEAGADFPVSFAQKRSTIMTLGQLNNPDINSVLFSPENAGTVQNYVGLRELKIPMENQRRKQVREITKLLNGAATPGPADPMTGMPGPMQSTVPVEPDLDDHAVHIEIMRDFLVSDAGQDLKEANPGAYANCLAHLMEHKALMGPAMPGQPMPGQGTPAKLPAPVGPPAPEAQAVPGGQPT